MREAQAGRRRAEAGHQAGCRCSDPGAGDGPWARVESGVEKWSDSTHVCKYSPRGLLTAGQRCKRKSDARYDLRGLALRDGKSGCRV